MRTGTGTLVYAMKVTGKCKLVDYKNKYPNRIDADRLDREKERFALISDRFIYYGAKAARRKLSSFRGQVT